MSRTAWMRPGRAVYWPALAALTAGLALAVAFTGFMTYDDEGYLLMFASKLAGGGRLYDEVFGQYGPAYALWKTLVHGVLRVPVSHAGVRMETVALVMAALSLIVLGVHRLTGAAWAAALALYACQWHVLLMAGHEPGHPQFLCLLLLVAAVWLAGAAAVRHAARALAAAAGALVALLSLTKLNAGVFLGLAILTWRALPWIRRHPLRPALVCGVGVAVQLALFRSDPGLWSQWGWRYFLVSSLAMAAVVIAAGADGARPRSWPWRQPAAGAAGAALAVGLLTMARGTSVRALMDGALLQPLRLGTHFSVPAPVTAGSITLAAAGALAAAAWAVGRRSGGRAVAAPGVLGIARLAFGAFVVWRALTAYSAFVALEACAGLWLLAAGDRREETAAGTADIGALAALAAAWQVPYAFPVAGTQTGYVAALVVACGVVSLHGGIRWLAEAGRGHAGRLLEAKTALAAATLGLVLAGQAAALAAHRRQYDHLRPLGLRGAGGVRVAPDQAELLQRVTAAISAAGCGRLVSFPGMFSFNFWADADSPTGVNVTAWMILPAREQVRLLADVERATPVCVLRNRAREAAWARRDVAADPIARWLEARPLEPLARAGDYELSRTARAAR